MKLLPMHVFALGKEAEASKQKLCFYHDVDHIMGNM